MKTKRLSLLMMIVMVLVACSRGLAEDAPSSIPISDEPAAPSPTPVTVRPGVTILADGVVQPVQPMLPLAFETGGRLMAVHVQAGDLVQAGDEIASLDDTHAQDQVAQAQLNLRVAELALEDLTKEADPAALATALASLASAQANLADLTLPPDDQQVLAARQNLNGAKQALQDLLDPPDPDQIQIAAANLAAVEIQLQAAQGAYDQVAHLADVGMTQEAMNLQQATINYERAQAEYNQTLEGASDGQIANARAQVAQAEADLDTLLKGPDPDALAAAEAQVEQAQAGLDKLLDGASAKDLATAEINVAQAQLALESALRSLSDVELIAPASGTVTAVEVVPGSLVSSNVPIVTLLDTTHLEFHTTNLSERDLAEILPGRTALVTLKAYPDDPIEATVVRIGVQAGAAVLGDAATFPVVLVLNETDLDIRPGMTGRVEIRTEKERKN